MQEIVSMSQALRMRLFSASTDEADSFLNFKLKESYPETVSCFAGLHPSEASDHPLSAKLVALIQRADGVGEIGLDPKYSEVGTGSAQYSTLLAQLDVAEKMRKPVQVHSRNAERGILDALASFRLKSVLLHWFEGEEFVTEASSRGYFVSFGPPLLYSKRIKRIAKAYPSDLVLTESDAPVVYKPLGESAKGPSLVPSVIFMLAEVWGFDYAETESRTSENAFRFINVR